MKPRILIIDDETEIRRLLCRAIEGYGYEVRAAADGRVGLSDCKTWQPHLVLTDIFMPEQDGLETIRFLRKALPDVKIVVMSGGGNVGDLSMMRVARALGAERALPKPFDLGDLKRLLYELVPLETT